MKLLLGSGGFSTEKRRENWRKSFSSFLNDETSFIFIPYAIEDYDDYCEKMRKFEFDAKIPFKGIHEFEDPIKAIEECEAIFVGGGNSFRLLHTIQEKKLIGPIQKAVKAGVPYIGISAGTNMACPTIKTTNDMPIVHPKDLNALSLIPFQINPHYFSGKTHIKLEDDSYMPYGGETRDDRIREFHEMNDQPVLGLWEGEILHIDESGKGHLEGEEGARLFLKGKDAKDLSKENFTLDF